MCQLNLIFVKNLKNKKILKEQEYDYFKYNFSNYFPYVKGFCNCGSFVGSMSEYSGNSYYEMTEEITKSKLENLNKIKSLMNTPGYTEQKEKYIADRETLSNALTDFFEPLSNYEMEQIHLLETKYKGKALEKHIELLYKELDKKSQKIENSIDYKSAESKFNEFIEKNQLIEESTLYYLTKEEEDNDKKLEEMTDADLLDSEDNSIEYIDVYEESFVIDTVIQKTENKYPKDYNDFLEYKQLFEKLLENDAFILFCCIWDNPENMLIEKEVNIKDIQIEDLASLKYNQILKIYK